ncbi:YihY/virulence factor BrkB family protein [Haloarcula sp. S1AR25-5A]|uniref:YihY/virulence factor BrkB family protein n=1 Tax=Haloarcula terrestris TaxID=2950533 RepID=A0AAE4EUU8_9EURY|nr:YihY/virulence factor BrkB family protein [Haloarcula terrestris]MDS0220545.1 YihY/virulence factor BrkB family protein [Haloarcula terrestris]
MSRLAAGREIVRTVREENVPFMAASIAYYAIASIVPLFALSLAVLSAFGGTATLIELLRTVLAENGQAILTELLENTRGHGATGTLSLLFVVWSGSKVFRGLSIAFTEVYGEVTDISLPAQFARSVVVMGVLFGAVVLLSATSIALTYVQFRVPYPMLVGNLAALAVLVVAFVPIYYVLPPVDITLAHVVPGTLLAAAGWITIQVGVFYYAGAAGRYAAYGYLGALLLFVTALYLAAIVLLLGVVVNATLDW